MPTYLPFVMIGLAVVGLLVWSLAHLHRRTRAQKAAAAQAGFRPCPEQKGWLEETVARIENNRGHRYQVRDPKRVPGEPPVYCYVKARQRAHDDVFAEEEILFPVKRRSAQGLVLSVKPASLAPGLATRLIGALATGPWDAQPDDLQRLELPPDLREGNVMAALGPPGASLYDLLDSHLLAVVQGLGDAGALSVRFRDGWCAVAGAGAQIPFRVDEVVARIRPLL